MKKYEFKRIVGFPNNDDVLNELKNLGEKGWCMISAYPSSIDKHSNILITKNVCFWLQREIL